MSLFVVAGIVVAAVVRLRSTDEGPSRAGERGPVPVEVAEIVRGLIQQKRVFSGALEATALVEVAPKVGGRVVTLAVDLSDQVTRGQVIATLDREEHEQAVVQAQAELAVRRASLTGSESAAAIAEREYERMVSLHEQSVVSDSELDLARADHLSRQAELEMGRAEIKLAEAALASARIRLEYTTVRADWSVGDDARVVAERYAEEGDTVSVGTPLISVVELTPIKAVIFATESDYANLRPGQPITLTTNAYPGREWTGEVSRVAPVFREGSRQARVELQIPNDDRALKPGMFVRAEAVLSEAADATIVPEAALTLRGGRNVVFIVTPDGSSVRMVPVETGIRDAGRVQVTGLQTDAATSSEPDTIISGRVVTLGQQLVSDGSIVRVPEQPTTSEPDSVGDR